MEFREKLLLGALDKLFLGLLAGGAALVVESYLTDKQGREEFRRETGRIFSSQIFSEAKSASAALETYFRNLSYTASNREKSEEEGKTNFVELRDQFEIATEGLIRIGLSLDSVSNAETGISIGRKISCNHETIDKELARHAAAALRNTPARDDDEIGALDGETIKQLQISLRGARSEYEAQIVALLSYAAATEYGDNNTEQLKSLLFRFILIYALVFLILFALANWNSILEKVEKMDSETSSHSKNIETDMKWGR